MKRPYSLQLLIAVFIFIGCQQGSKDEIKGISVQHKVFINKPIKEVYESYTTTAGLEGFLAPSVKMTLNKDSTFTTSPEINANLNEPGHVKNKILLADKPNKLLIKIVSAPPYLPYSLELSDLHTHLKFQSKDDGTEVIGTTYGFDKLSDSSAFIALFKSINQFTFDQLKNYHEASRVDWEKMSNPSSLLSRRGISKAM